MHHAILQSFCAKSIQADKIICVAMACADWEDRLPDDFEEEFFWDFLADTNPTDANVAPLVECLPDIVDLIGREDFDELTAAHAAEWFLANGHLGFLAQVSTPVSTFYPGGEIRSSWGCIYTTWSM